MDNDGGRMKRHDAAPPTIRNWLIAQLSQRLHVSVEAIAGGERFSRYGLDSLNATGLISDLSAELGRPLSPTLMWEHPTLDALARHLEGPPAGEPKSAGAQSVRGTEDEPIAIVGLACRFPGAPGPEAFWRLLRDGGDAVREVPPDRWDSRALYDPDLKVPGKMNTCRGGFLERVDTFDPLFFDISPREALTMDPQQRLMLELSVEALQDAGIVPESLRGAAAAVIFGVVWTDYNTHAQRRGLPGIVQHTVTGFHHSMVANRVSYALGLQGPSLAVDTACSSSLVAVHLACASLRSGEAEVALVGGVNLNIVPESTLGVSKFGGLSPDGQCFTFDARANGYVRGEGGGVVVLKRLAQAITDGDTIYCSIRGSAVNNDGASNGLTAPNPAAQEAVLRDAYTRATIDPADVDYVEAHGTGTFLGDPIEARALGAVLSAGRSASRELLVGSVKTNIGHLEAAAGIASVIKVALCFRHGRLPASLHFERPNPHIPFEALNLRVVRALSSWPARTRAGIAGVSAFGFGGTNCHVVLEGPPLRTELAVLSGANREELHRSTRRLLDRLSSPAVGTLASICGALAAGGAPLSCRAAIRARSRLDLERELRGLLDGEERLSLSLHEEALDPLSQRVAFIFAGQGSHWPGMGRRLLSTEPVFRAVLERCDRLIRDLLGWSLLTELSAAPERSRLHDIDVSCPAIVAVEIALAELWRAWGIAPTAVVGHSIGEVAAAYVAGVLDLEDAMRVICTYGRLILRLRGQGTMGLIGLSWEATAGVLERFAGRVVRAIHASPDSTVVSGEGGAIAELFSTLEPRGIPCQRIRVDVAAHSPQVDPLREELLETLGSVRSAPAHTRFFSGVTGAEIDGRRLNATHWARNLAEPVMFFEAVTALLREGACGSLLEVSPHPIMKHPLEAILRHHGRRIAVYPSLRRDEDERDVLFSTLGALYVKGATVRWREIYPRGISGEAWGDSVAAKGAEAGRPLVEDDVVCRAGECMDAPRVDKAGEEESGARLVVLSARSEEALKGMAGELRGFLESPAGEGVEVSDVAYTRARHRSHLAYRLAVVAESRRELQAALADFQNGAGSGVVTRRPVRAGSRPSLVFVFSGQGSQMAGMGRGLQQEYPVFRHSLEHVSECLRRQTGLWLPEELSAPREQSRLHLTEVAQPALFAMQVSLVALLRNWGLEPDAVIGHSAGEVAAAYTSGALSLEGAVELVALRAKFMEEAARERGAGGMAVVALDEGRVKEALAGYETRVSVAAVNGPLSVVVSGERGALEEVLQGLEEKGERVRRLEGGYAFHSPQMEGAAERLAEALAGLKSEPLGRVMYSTVEGEEVRVGSLSGRYWGENVRGCVRFKAAVERAASEGERVFVEIGGHPVLRGDVEETLRAGGYEGEVVGTLRRGVEEGRALLEGVGRLYEQGVDPEWRGMNGAGGRRVSLPTYPWQRERYWLELGGEERSGDSEPVEERGGGRLLERGFEVATMPGVRFYEGGLSLERQPYLSGHGVGGAVVLPGAAYVRMLLEAGQEEYGAAEVELEEVRFERLLELEEGEERQVQVTLRAEEGRRARGEVYSRRGRGRGEAWERHASAVLVAYEGGSRRPGEPAIALEAVLGRCSRRESGEAYYARLSGLGLEYGGSFQCVREVWYGRGELVGRVELEAGEGRLEGEAYGVPPALLDGCLQLIGGLLGGAGGGAPVPVGAERIGLRVRGAGRLWVHVRKREEEGGEGGGLYDLQLREEGGEEVGRVDGLRVRRSERREGEEEERWRYELKWERREAEEGGRVGERLASGRRDGERKAGGSWLVLSDRGGCGSALVRTLERAGERGVRVMAGPEYRGLEADIYEVNPSRGEDLVRVLREVYGAGEVCRGVVHLWGLDVCDGEEGEDGGWESGGRAALEGLLHVVQGVVQRGWRDPPRLVVVTRGCQAVVAGERGEVWQSPLWGLGRVLRYEHPELGWLGVDLEAGGDGSESEALWEESRRDDGEDQVALRGGARFVARLTRAEGRRPASTGPAWKQEAGGTAASPVEGEGSYLITGGLGGLGLTVADWLVSQGARHLVLVSRREPDAGTQGLVEALRAQGAQVMVACADVSRVEDLAGVMARVESELPPLRGVVHAAGVLDDGLLVNQDSERFARVLAPKVQGAWNLHTVTRSQPLKWFVMFSSAASLLGSPGQASYAAGNAFLDALSVYRRSQGLPGMSIQWGPWAEVGMAAAEQRRGERLAHRGMSSIPTALALRLFDRLLMEHPPLAGVLPLDVRRWLEFHPGVAVLRFWTDLLAERLKHAPARTSPVLDTIRAAPPIERAGMVQRHVAEAVGRVLHLDASRLDRFVAFGSLGLDSLLSLELRHQLESSFLVRLPSTLLFTYPNLDTLIGHLSERLDLGRLPQQTGLSQTQESELNDQQRIAALRSLSHGEAEALLEERLRRFDEQFQ